MTRCHQEEKAQRIPEAHGINRECLPGGHVQLLTVLRYQELIHKISKEDRKKSYEIKTTRYKNLIIHHLKSNEELTVNVKLCAITYRRKQAASHSCFPHHRKSPKTGNAEESSITEAGDRIATHQTFGRGHLQEREIANPKTEKLTPRETKVTEQIHTETKRSG